MFETRYQRYGFFYGQQLGDHDLERNTLVWKTILFNSLLTVAQL